MPDDDEVLFDDDPWKLRQLASAVQAVLFERWDLQQVLLLFMYLCIQLFVLFCNLWF
jgi:hypothetical protein